MSFPRIKNLSPTRSDVAWACVPLAAVAAAVVLAIAGLNAGGWANIVLVAVSSAAAMLLVARIRVWEALDARHVPVPLRMVVLVAMASGLGMLALELPYNPSWYAIKPVGAALELAIIATALAGALLICQRHGAVAAAGETILATVGIAQYYVLAFKGTAIMPSDLTALSTAAEVAGTYDYSLSEGPILGIAAAVAGIATLGLASARSAQAVERGLRPGLPQPAKVVLTLALGVTCVLGCKWIATGTSYYWTYGIGIDFFKPIKTYRAQGLLPGFIAAAQDMPIAEPDGYTAEEAQRIQDELVGRYDDGSAAADAHAEAAAQFDAIQPAVICIMNETFADLSTMEALDDAGYEGPTYFRSIDDALYTGTLYASVMGGGTCNTEFEFLTGNSLAYVGASKYPYTLYKLDGIESLASQFASIGYRTTAIHPNLATNWDRDKVFPSLGFDRFLDITAFEEAPTFHNGVTDRATYDAILDLLAADDTPQFVFDVTMQNHGSYDVGNIPADRLTDIQPAGLDADTTAQLDEYLSCIQASDEDLAYLLGELEKVDRPVVVVFFGDHQPGISPSLNDAFYADEDPDSIEHVQRIYETDYVIWANYDVAANAQESERLDASAAGLGDVFMQAIGAPLTDYQKARLVTMRTMPALNLIGYTDASGNWYPRGDKDSPIASAYSDLQKVEYLNFGSRVQ